jgi:hypothetical protein
MVIVFFPKRRVPLRQARSVLLSGLPTQQKLHFRKASPIHRSRLIVDLIEQTLEIQTRLLA